MSETGLAGAVKEVIERLGLEGRLPAPGLVEELHRRFAARIPYQDPELPGLEAVLEGFLENGTGASGILRTRLFLALARAVGIPAEPVAGCRPDGLPHAVALIRGSGGGLLAAPGLPLPALLPLQDGCEVASALGTLKVDPAPTGPARLRRVMVEARGERRELIRFSAEPVSEEDLIEGGPFDVADPAPPSLLRHLEDRALSWRDGIFEVADSWSRLLLPVPASSREDLAALFDQPLPPSLDRVPPGAGVEQEPVLSVSIAAAARGEQILALLHDPDGFLAAAPEGIRAEELEPDATGWTWRLADEAGTAIRTERLRPAPDGLTVSLTGGDWVFGERRYAVRPRENGALLEVSASFSGPVPPRGPLEATRKALVFHLATELLALDRAASG